MTEVPVIDLVHAEQDPSALVPLDLACRDHGFFLLENHGIDEVIDEMWQASATFFDLPQAEKRKILRSDSIPLGFYDRELTKRKRDLKEVFDYMLSREDRTDLNQWPANQLEFRQAMEKFFIQASDIAERTLQLVYRALNRQVGQETGCPPGDPRTSNVRLNYYPLSDPLSGAEAGAVAGLGDMALHHHTDPGILTLLLQDMTGGLQALSKTEGWIDVTPKAGTIVVNLGDAMQVWTNDNYRAAVHRVIPMAQTARYSTPYFYNPRNDAVLEPITGLTQGAPRFSSFTWRDYIKGRVDDNFADLGEDDIQIDKYRIAV